MSRPRSTKTIAEKKQEARDAQERFQQRQKEGRSVIPVKGLELDDIVRLRGVFDVHQEKLAARLVRSGDLDPNVSDIPESIAAALFAALKKSWAK
jgi:hypothetical protein